MDPLLQELRRLDRAHVHAVWEAVRDGREAGLPEEDRVLGRILLEHPEYRNSFEFADLTADHEYDPDRETDPFLHVLLHQVAEAQLASGEPPEAAAFVRDQMALGAERHEAVHLLCQAVARLVFGALHGREAPSEAYAEALRRVLGVEPEHVAGALERELGALLDLEGSPTRGPEGLRHEVVRHLFDQGNALAPDVLREIVALGDEVVPDLLALLDEAEDCPERYEDLPDERTYFPIHALFLLAELGPGPWFSRFLSFLTQDAETLDFWFGDMVLEDLWEITAKGGEGHLPEIEAFLGDTEEDAYARGAVSLGLAQLAAYRPELREQALAVFRRLLSGAAERVAKAEDSCGEREFLGNLVADLMDVGLRELEPEIRTAFAAGLVPEHIVGAEEGFLDDGSMVRELLPIEARYAEFREKYRSGPGEEDDDGAGEPLEWDEPLEPYVRPAPKVGRNDPCPCGSGAKYKKCCGG